MSDQWYIARNKKKYGPCPFQQLQQLARSGRLLPTEMVRATGTQTWQQADSVLGLFDAPEANAVPPITPVAPYPTTPVAANTPPPVASRLPIHRAVVAGVGIGGCAVVLLCGGIYALVSKPTAQVVQAGQTSADRPPTDAMPAQTTKNGQDGGKAPIPANPSPPTEPPPQVATPTEPPPQVVTEDFFPFKAGVVTYFDSQTGEEGESISVMRLKHEQKENGIIEWSVIQQGLLSKGQGLLKGDKPRWISSANTKSKPQHYRVRDGFIEVGHHLLHFLKNCRLLATG